MEDDFPFQLGDFLVPADDIFWGVVNLCDEVRFTPIGGEINFSACTIDVSEVMPSPVDMERIVSLEFPRISKAKRLEKTSNTSHE